MGIHRVFRQNQLFVEKPVALTSAEGDALLQKQKETGCQVQVGQVIRFWDEYVELQKMVESRVYGEVVNANFRRLSPLPTWGWNNWLLDFKLSGGAGQDLHIHDVDYVLSLFGVPASYSTVKNVRGDRNSYIATVMQYPSFAVSVEGTWDLPASYPFTATFRVVFEKAVVENAGGKLTVFDENGSHTVTIEKKQLEGGFKGGNISDLGGYYNELLYFVGRAKEGKAADRATLSDGVASLKFVLKEIGNE